VRKDAHEQGAAARGSRVLRSLALVVAGLTTLVGGAFATGEALDDPGGVTGAGIVASWLVPLVALTVLAWRRPVLARRMLAGLAAALAAVAVTSAVAADSWRSLEDDHGPVRAIAAFALLLPLAVLGWKQPRSAGALLLVVAIAPVVIPELGGGPAGAPALAGALPAALAGLVLLLAAAVRGPSPARRRLQV
jgi:hypothetical protein